jgi:hypothetical protein
MENVKFSRMSIFAIFAGLPPTTKFFYREFLLTAHLEMTLRSTANFSLGSFPHIYRTVKICRFAGIGKIMVQLVWTYEQYINMFLSFFRYMVFKCKRRTKRNRAHNQQYKGLRKHKRIGESGCKAQFKLGYSPSLKKMQRNCIIKKAFRDIIVCISLSSPLPFCTQPSTGAWK